MRATQGNFFLGLVCLLQLHLSRHLWRTAVAKFLRVCGAGDLDEWLCSFWSLFILVYKIIMIFTLSAAWKYLPKNLGLIAALSWWESSDVTLVVLTSYKPTSSPPCLTFPLLTFISLETQQHPEFLPLAHKHNSTLVSSRTDDSEFLSLISTVTKWEQDSVCIKSRGNCTVAQMWSYQHLTEVQGHVFSGDSFSFSWKSVDWQ